jgi:hypothetical protein
MIVLRFKATGSNGILFVVFNVLLSVLLSVLLDMYPIKG